MPVERPTPDSFVVIDLEGAVRADGVVRWARKILLDGARWLARSRTYGWATLGEQVSGASAGVSAVPESRDAALAEFDAAPPGETRLGLDAGKGVGWDDLPSRTAADWRNAVLRTDPAPLRMQLVATGAVAGARAQLGELADRTVAIEGPAEVVPVLTGAFTEAGATVLEQEDTTLAGAAAVGADLLVCGSAVGLVDHQAAASLECALVVPWGPMPVTTRALAVARRRGVEVLPDFVTTVGPLVAAVTDTPDPELLLRTTTDTVAGVVAEVRDHEQGPLIGACVRAESFLSTWQDTLPFGRPIA